MFLHCGKKLCCHSIYDFFIILLTCPLLAFCPTWHIYSKSKFPPLSLLVCFLVQSPRLFHRFVPGHFEPVLANCASGDWSCACLLDFRVFGLYLLLLLDQKVCLCWTAIWFWLSPALTQFFGNYQSNLPDGFVPPLPPLLCSHYATNNNQDIVIKYTLIHKYLCQQQSLIRLINQSFKYPHNTQ